MSIPYVVNLEPDFVIGIGASAGGMEEINAFFDYTPLDGVSYVIVQHLSADFKSRMVELLSKHSKLQVREAENGMKVQRNEVYLIPNDQFMTIREGSLFLKAKGSSPGPHLTINTFFLSLAANSGSKAIGIVLSGLGSDGTEGIKAIKRAGGAVFARDPEGSAFGSMPSSAIATGMVDLVLEPSQMPEAIEDYVKQQQQDLAYQQDDEQVLTEIVSLIMETEPLDFSGYKRSTIMRRTQRRAAYLHCESLREYLAYLKKTPGEPALLSKDFLISVTSFFRDKEAYEVIRTQVLPVIRQQVPPGGELKIWVAGCATGEEAYSLAILIAEQTVTTRDSAIVKIFATDLDREALQHAGKGVYDQGIEKDVSAERLKRFFIKEGTHYRVSPAIRSMLLFAQHDLTKNPPYCNVDLISCRNLMIYMKQPLQKKVYSMLLFGLKMNGFMFLGASENPVPILDSLEVTDKKWRIYKNIKTQRVMAFDTFVLPEVLDLQHVAHTGQVKPQPDGGQHLAETMLGVVASQKDELLVCVDDNHEVVNYFGDPAKFLNQQNFKTNLLALLPKPLALAYSTLMSSVKTSGLRAAVRGIPPHPQSTSAGVKLAISPLKAPGENRPYFMVSFQEDLLPPETGNEPVFETDSFYSQYLHSLELELVATKEKLQHTLELLDASNENMQSFNEELISANEEMQSTNEEMQSVNEELHTINADYQLKNRELLELNDDLNNYFRSNINGQIVVNRELLLMKFSPGTVKLFNLLETDVGRPLSHISSHFQLDPILADLKQVLAEETTITKELESDHGRWYQAVTMPYLQADGQCIGAIVTFHDVTALKVVQQELDMRNESLQRINTDLDNFAHTASHDLLGPLGVIQLVIEVLNQKVKGPELQEYLGIMNSSIFNFSTLIKDIGTFAAMETGMLKPEMINLSDLLTDIEWSLSDKIKASGAVIRKDMVVGELFFSKKNLRSILYNLISNAIKYRGKATPQILVQSREETHFVVITVTDNGMGIKKSGFETIFHIYGRLHQQLEGSGIGLYLVKRIMNAAMGSITVESEPGKGSSFILHFRKSGGIV